MHCPLNFVSRPLYYVKYYGKGEGGGKWPAGEKNEIRSKGKKLKRGKKKVENYIKKGGRALKMHLFGLLPQKNFAFV